MNINDIDFEQLYLGICQLANLDVWLTPLQLSHMLYEIFGEVVPDELMFEIADVMINLGMLQKHSLPHAYWYFLCPMSFRAVTIQEGEDIDHRPHQLTKRIAKCLQIMKGLRE